MATKSDLEQRLAKVRTKADEATAAIARRIDDLGAQVASGQGVNAAEFAALKADVLAGINGIVPDDDAGTTPAPETPPADEQPAPPA